MTLVTKLGEHARTTDKRDGIIRELTSERDALMAAGKLAMIALEKGGLLDATLAIAALKSVRVV